MVAAHCTSSKRPILGRDAARNPNGILVRLLQPERGVLMQDGAAGESVLYPRNAIGKKFIMFYRAMVTSYNAASATAAW